jgi:hypothetical protein
VQFLLRFLISQSLNCDSLNHRRVKQVAPNTWPHIHSDIVHFQSIGNAPSQSAQSRESNASSNALLPQGCPNRGLPGKAGYEVTSPSNPPFAVPRIHLPDTVTTVDHYANVVLAVEGKCWRMVVPAGLATMRHPTDCPEPVCWVGRHRWRSGEWVRVWSCDGHADDLMGV